MLDLGTKKKETRNLLSPLSLLTYCASMLSLVIDFRLPGGNHHRDAKVSTVIEAGSQNAMVLLTTNPNRYGRHTMSVVCQTVHPFSFEISIASVFGIP